MMIREPVSALYSHFRYFRLGNTADLAKNESLAKEWVERGILLSAETQRGKRMYNNSMVPHMFHLYVLEQLAIFSSCLQERPGDPQWHWVCVATNSRGSGTRPGANDRDARLTPFLVGGIYAYKLAWWFDVVGARDRTLVIPLEELKHNPDAAIDAFEAHVGLRARPQASQQLRGNLRGGRAQSRQARKLGAATSARNVNSVSAPMLPETKKLLEDFYAPYNAMLADLLGERVY